jgi:uncharacterized protein YecE (DUF72 family)
MVKVKPRFLVGTSGWSYDHWKKTFYPEDRPKSRWFAYYVQNFPTVEVNATFYRFFRDSTFLKWKENAPENFLYVFKVPRLITHRKYLRDVQESIQGFRRSVALLEEKLGLVLLQLAPSMPYDLERLQRALAEFGDRVKVAVEFRHERWFTDDTRAMLRKTGAVFCTADSPKTELMDWVTSDTAYIRLHGRSRWYAYNYTDTELEAIAALAENLAKQGAKKVYIFFNNDFKAYAPRNALRIMQILQDR